jgi:hypothetical protein
VSANAQFESGGTVVFDNGQNAIDIPFELNSDKIYLQVTLDNNGPYWLVLDTGSPAMILDTRVGEELGIPTREGFEAGGAGERPFVLAPADSTLDAALPGVKLLAQPAFIGAIDAVVGPFEGRRIDGVLGGYNLFSGHIVEVDYIAQTIGIHERDGYTAPDQGTVVPIAVDEGHCSIEATSVLLDGDSLTGTFLLDTGLRGTLIFSSPYTNTNGLLDRCGPTIYTTTGGGIGGQVKTHVGRLADFIFGGFALGGIHVSLSQLTSGALASEYYAGIIGSAVLQRFRVVFDYAGDRLILTEVDYNEDRLAFDKSGAFLVSDLADRSVYRVIDVIEDSPADEAGLQIGDIIRMIDGTPAADISLEQARRLFRRPAGTTFSIHYERDGKRHASTLTLKELL